MLFRLKAYRLFLKVMVYVLPFAAFEMGLASLGLQHGGCRSPSFLLSRRASPSRDVQLLCMGIHGGATHHVTSVDELFR